MSFSLKNLLLGLTLSIVGATIISVVAPTTPMGVYIVFGGATGFLFPVYEIKKPKG